MYDILYLILGIILLAIGLFDFFYTTLSASYSSFISPTVSRLVHKIILIAAKKFGRNVFSISGLVINLIIITVWIVTIWAGLYFLFTYDAQAIVDSAGNIANSGERLYFTGFVLSTLGIGDFKPVSHFSQILTSGFSFFGFIFFTTAMTYLISVYSAVINKRHLALAIRNLGNSPEELIRTLHNAHPTFIYSQIISLQLKIDLVNEQYQAYPLIHYYHNADIDSSFALNITKLDEALTIMLSKAHSPHHREIQFLKISMDALIKKFGDFHKVVNLKMAIEDITWKHLGHSLEIAGKELAENPEVVERRKILSSMLLHEALTWNHVYESHELEEND